MQIFDDLLIAVMFLLVENGVARKHTNLSRMLSRQFFLGWNWDKPPLTWKPTQPGCFFFNGCLVTQLLLMEEIQHQLVDSL